MEKDTNKAAVIQVEEWTLFSVSFTRASATVPAIATVTTITRRPHRAVADITAQEAVAIYTAPPTLAPLIDQHGHGTHTGTRGDGEETQQ